jgi:hypothetical protein
LLPGDEDAVALFKDLFLPVEGQMVAILGASKPGAARPCSATRSGAGAITGGNWRWPTRTYLGRMVSCQKNLPGW